MPELKNRAYGGENVEVPNQNEANSPSPINPLEISEILEVVMNHAPVETLKNARLVCKSWRKESTPRLFNTGYFTVPSNFYTLGQKERDSIISHMKKFLNSNPDPRIRLPNVQLLQYPDLAIFDKISPTIVGPLVEKLVFGLHDHPALLQNLLLKRLPNLRVLDPRPLSLGNDELPLHFCYELLNICAGVIAHLGNPFRPRNLPLTLADLNMFVHCGEDAHCMEKFSFFTFLPNIFISKLSFGFSAFPDNPCFPDIRERMSGILSRLLEKNKDVLTSLRVWGSEMYWAETVVPILPKVEFFYLSIYPPRRRHSIFVPPKYSLPPNFQFAVNMPNLKEMDIFYSFNELTSTRPEEDKNIPNFLAGYFDGQKPAVSVKEMTYCDFGCDFNLDPLLKCFSALETFSYTSLSDFGKGARSLFTFGRELKNLRIGLILEDLTSKISSFDSILTGFSQGTVDKIKNASTSKGKTLKEILGASGDFSVDSLRIQPSILDLPKLELIVFKIIGDSMKYLPNKVFTVAGKYAFKLRPKLKVEFHLGKCQPLQRAKNALKDISKLPNVEIKDDL